MKSKILDSLKLFKMKLLYNKNIINTWARTLVGLVVIGNIPTPSLWKTIFAYGIIIQWILIPIIKQYDLVKSRWKK